MLRNVNILLTPGVWCGDHYAKTCADCGSEQECKSELHASDCEWAYVNPSFTGCVRKGIEIR